MSAFWLPSVLCRENPGGRNYLESGISNGHAIKRRDLFCPAPTVQASLSLPHRPWPISLSCVYPRRRTSRASGLIACRLADLNLAPCLDELDHHLAAGDQLLCIDLSTHLDRLRSTTFRPPPGAARSLAQAARLDSVRPVVGTEASIILAAASTCAAWAANSIVSCCFLLFEQTSHGP